MSPESSLKVLVALNAVQMFITVLLVAILVSTGLSTGSSRSDSLADLAAFSHTNPADSLGMPSNDRVSSGEGVIPAAPEPNPAAMATAEGSDGAPPPGEVGPPGPPPSDAAAPPPPNPGEAPPPEAATPVVNREIATAQATTTQESKAGATLRSYLSLVSRRLDLAARASGVDPKPFLPSSDDLKAAVSSEDPSSEAFKKVTAQLKKGYETMGLEFPDLPTMPSGGP